ncbi:MULTISPECIES: hypothetical protein [Streptomyces]|uniref:hypothetical protein n=1 Tax=Streptomyces TaxID=1883 RepID=UPI0023818BA0|nr:MULTISPECIES: hypothetical protein [Streptomyces]MDX2747109.1 hypothetical protein [Streptomyces sp. NRRL_B-2557]MDX3060980.1 hypothetical protein [Streptomyces sp. ND04-05B]
MTEIRQFQADPGFPETLGVEFGVGRAQPAVYAYFADGQLHCVAIDAVRGPQVTLWGRELSGCVPADLERFSCCTLTGAKCSMCPTVRGGTPESTGSVW